MVDIGIIVISYNISNDTISKFIKNMNISMSYSNLNYEILIIDNKYDVLTEGIFNKSKALNIGIKKLLNIAKVILITDIDIIAEIGLVDLTYKKSIQTNSPVFALAKFVDSNITYDNISNYYAASYTYTGLGAWNAMIPDMWYKTGGFNEDLYGWGFDDNEFHYRLCKKNIDKVIIMTKFHFHIDHSPDRQYRTNSNRYYGNIIQSNAKDYSTYNWLEK
jgi:predicted glycosyltransferase involved in capsule biosynthesis